MKKISFAFACLGIVLSLVAVRPALAQNAHSYVSSNGSGNTCTFAAPCDFLQDAVNATIPGGVVTCLDNGTNRSTLVAISIISKSVTIDCAGTSAVSWYITINGSGIVVKLRNLVITDGVSGGLAPPGGIGIDFQNGAALFVEHCVIENFAAGLGAGIRFAPSSGNASLHVTDSFIRGNGVRGGGGGIYVTPTGGASARVTIERTVLDQNSNGIFANGQGGMVLVEVKGSTIGNNTSTGVWAYTTASIVSLVLDHTAATSNALGATAQGAGAYVVLRDATLVWNSIGMTTANGGAIVSYKNNLIGGNPNPGGVTPVAADLQ